jgi:hypothetical protein
MAGGGVPLQYKGREHVWDRKVKQYAEGGDVHMDKGGAAFGVFPQMKPRRAKQDPEAAKNVPVDLARGFASGVLGAPGDIESLARLPYELITGKDSPTFLPTSEDIEKRLPFRSEAPVSRAASGAGQLAGGFYLGPGSPLRAVGALPGAIKHGAQEFAMASAAAAPRLTVYHGSPHKFEKFDSSKIGTGEGAQAYGHGLYLAESPDVAKSYMGPGTSIGGAAFESRLLKLMEKAQDAGRYGEAGALEDLLVNRNPSMAYSKYSVENGYSPDTVAQAHATIKQFEDKFNPAGLYTVDLPDEKIARMLDYDKPLSQQSESVRKALEADKRAKDSLYQSGGEYYRALMARHAQNAPSHLSVDAAEIAAQAPASQQLRELGIPGIRYLDQGSRTSGKGTSNFVVFPGEEDALTILERKKEGGPVKMAGGGAMKEALKKLLKPMAAGGEVRMDNGGAAFGQYTTGRKYQAAKKRAENADVNLLPDPRTYAAVSGLLGEAPDELGFSVMHPDYKGIQSAGEKGFIGGTLLGAAPAAAPMTKGLPVGASIKPSGKGAMKGPQAEALRLARQRAALPVEQYGLGLPANNTAAQRAKAMKFEDRGFHETEAGNIEGGLLSFDPRRVGAAASDEQTPYAMFIKPHGANIGVARNNPVQMPLMIKTNLTDENIMRSFGNRDELQQYLNQFPDIKQATQAVRDLDNKMANYMKEIEKKADALYAEGKTKEADKLLDSLNFDSNLLKEFDARTNELAAISKKKITDLFNSQQVGTVALDRDAGAFGRSTMTEMVLNPAENVRSRFAAFDPFRRNAAIASAMGVAAPDLLAEEQEKAKGGKVKPTSGLSTVNKLCGCHD